MSSIIAWIKGLSLTAKIISAVVAGVVVIGGTTTAIIVATNSGGNDPADTGAPTSSVSESLTSEADSSVASTAESEATSSTEESSSTAASSQPDTTTSTPTTSTTPPTTSTPSTTETPQPVAFSVYINGKAASLGTWERINQKVTLKNEIDGAVRREIPGDVYVDAEKFITALGLKLVSDKVKADIGKRASTDNVLLVENKRTESADGYEIDWFAVVEGSNVMARSGMGYDKNDNITGEGYNPGVLSTLAPKMVGGKLYTPASLICELLGYQYELKDTGFYITK